jgi:hypothetical protein
MNKDEQTNLLHGVASIFLRCFFLSVTLLLLWFVFYWVAGDWAYNIHSRWFELSRHDFDLINYYGMALIKICAILFFLFPYLSIKLVLRKKERNT